MIEVEKQFTLLVRAINKELETLRAEKRRLETISEQQEQVKRGYELKLSQLNSKEALIEKEKAIDRNRKASLDVREGKIQAVEDRLRKL